MYYTFSAYATTRDGSERRATIQGFGSTYAAALAHATSYARVLFKGAAVIRIL